MLCRSTISCENQAMFISYHSYHPSSWKSLPIETPAVSYPTVARCHPLMCWVCTPSTCNTPLVWGQCSRFYVWPLTATFAAVETEQEELGCTNGDNTQRLHQSCLGHRHTDRPGGSSQICLWCAEGEPRPAARGQVRPDIELSLAHLGVRSIVILELAPRFIHEILIWYS